MCPPGGWLPCLVAGTLLAGSLAAQTPAGSGYLDSSICAQCHRQIAESYSRTGMGRSFRLASADVALPEFASEAFTHVASGERFSMARRGGKYFIRRDDESGKNALELSVDYVIGSRDHAGSYLHRTADNKLVQFPVSWYSENGGHWGMSPGYDMRGHQEFSREVSYRCMFCHNAYPEVDARMARWDSGTIYPERLPQGIDCQRCHGPGRDHVNAARRAADMRQVRSAVVNPARLPLERQMEICMQCHLEATSSPLPSALMRFGRSTFSYQPGEPLNNFLVFFDHAPGTGHEDKFEIVSAVYRFRKSSCFQKSGSAFGCTACHDPHRVSTRQETVQKTVQVCQGCHNPTLQQRARELHPASDDCVGCHMPQRNAEDVVHVTMTDHWITARPAPLKSHDRRHDGSALPYAGKVALYYPQDLPQTDENQLLLAVAQVKHLANLPEGLATMQALLARIRPREARPFFEVAEALRNSAQAKQAIPFYQEAVKQDPTEWRYLYGLAQARQAAGSLAEAVRTYQAARGISSDLGSVLLALGGAYSEQGNLTLAAAALRQALTQSIERADIQGQLGNVLLRLGHREEAERTLREAVRLDPQTAAIRVNLANVLIAEHRLDDAKRELTAALNAGPRVELAQAEWFAALAETGSVSAAASRYQESLRSQSAPVHINLGTLHMMQGDTEGALGQYKLAVSADARSGVAQTNLALALMQTGNVTEARKRLEEAVRLNSDLFEARLHLGELLLSLGDPASATPHLQRAALSPDPRIRKEAMNLLNRKR